MTKPTDIDPIDHLIDSYEEAWSVDSSEHLYQWLQRFELDSCDVAATELIRVDIQRRYQSGLNVDLAGYVDQLPGLKENPPRLQEIAFEDYRSRKQHFLPLDADRWKDVPGVSDLTWFQNLAHGKTPRVGHRRSLRLNPVAGPTFSDANPSPLGSRTENDSLLISELQQLGFDVLTRLGDGALSVVYLATQRSLSDRHVVLKVVSNHLNEPEHLARLQHTNIVPIYSFHQLAHGSVICMPYWGSVTLEDYLNENPSSFQRIGQTFVATLIDRKQINCSRRSRAPGCGAKTG